MNVLILGASGLVGGNMLRHFSGFENIKVVGTHFSYATAHTVAFNTLDLDDPDNFDVDGFAPDVIVHCGALTWVDYCEENIDESYQKTVVSTINALRIAEKYDSKVVYLSTDYVFDGKNGPYRETDTVHPLSVYGRHKLEAEELVLKNDANLVLRITNVYGDEERNKNFVARLVQNYLNKTEITLKLPYDQYATPVNASDIARAARLLLTDGKRGIYHIASTDFVNRVQLANRVLKHLPGHRMSIVPVATAEIDPPAKRPLLGGLITEKFLSDYPDFQFSNVDDYLTGLKPA